MNRPRPSSETRAGLFVTIDGPSGVGKTTTITHLARLLAAEGFPVRTTGEPSAGPIGRLARELTDAVTGPALACLYAADRYHHLQTEIWPLIEGGYLVLCDRYVPSALVMQRLDGLAPEFLWGLNALADRPHLAVVLTAEPAVISARLADRGPHNRLQLQPDSSAAEARFYEDACELLSEVGYESLRLDTGTLPPRVAAAQILAAIRRLPEPASADLLPADVRECSG